MKNLHTTIRTIRRFSDLTQTEAAEALGISKSHLGEIENGKKTPMLAWLQNFSGFFEIPVSEILWMAENYGKQPEECDQSVHPSIKAMLGFVA